MAKPFETLTIQHVAQFPRPGTVIPASVRFTPDGKALTYLYSAEGTLVRSLWRYDIATGDRTVLAGPPAASTDEGQLSREEELRRERARLRELGVTSYEWARAAKPPVLLVPGGGRLYAAVGKRSVSEIEGTEGALDPKLSRDGSQVAFVRGDELWVAHVRDGGARKLTDGAEEGVTNGVAEFIAQEELDRGDGFWWSPDGTKIAYIKADSRHIPKYAIVHQGKNEVDLEEHRYPFAGAPNAYLELGVVDLDTGHTRWMHLGDEKDIYIARVGWRPDGVLTAQLLSRDQRNLRLVEFDDSGAASTLIEEQQEPWLNLHDDLRFLRGNKILWSSERTGFRHLYLYEPRRKEPRQLTDGDWMVTRVVAVDEKAGLVYFEGTRESVLERHLYRVPLAGGETERLTTEPGWHATVVSTASGLFVDQHSSMTHAPRITLRSFDGEEVAVLEANEGNSAEALGLPLAELVEIPAADGQTVMKGALYSPPGAGSDTQYPVIVSVYGGPHAQRVMDEWSLTVDLRAQYLAQQGFVVLKVDNRGSANRGLLFEAGLHLRMGTIEVEDQKAAVEWLRGREYCDTSRVGIYGWSYGGYMTAMCMMREPETFKVGVSGAPVSDWDGYDTGYTERYMSTPQENPDGYRDGSLLRHAPKLRGKLLLVHGGVDENVHFRHTARLITALTDADRDYDLLLFPEERHMPRGQKGMEYQERKLVEYFKQWL